MTDHAPTPTTPERLAAHPDVIAVFVFACDLSTVPLPESMHGSHARQWLGVADSFTRACADANAEDRAVMHLGDAQVLRYLRHDKRAIVVVMPFTTATLGKSIWRAMRVALGHMDNPKQHARTEAA